MAQELLTRPESVEQPLSTADLLKRDQPAPVAVQKEGGATHDPLFVATESEGFRNRWHDVQGSFVDEPRQAVQKADELVAAVIQRLTEVFAQERDKMEHDWSQGQDVSTEDLRQALRRYRSFFDRLLSM